MAKKSPAKKALPPAGEKPKTREERILKAVETNLRLYKSIEPPNEVLLQAETKTCKSCGTTGKVMQLFGVYVDRIGVTRAQTVCKACRNLPPDRKRPRVVRPITKTLATYMTPEERRRYFDIYDAVIQRAAGQK